MQNVENKIKYLNIRIIMRFANYAFLVLLAMGCKKEETPSNCSDVEPKQAMREFVIGISQYAKKTNPTFAIIPQNGIELVTENAAESGKKSTAYLEAIDGHGQEDFLFGYDQDNEATPTENTEYLKAFLDISKNAGNTILITDYCSTDSKMDKSYNQNEASGYVSFAADERELNRIPSYPNPIRKENSGVIVALKDVKNFLYLINPEKFTSKADFVEAIKTTNYDLLIMDFFFHDESEFTTNEITELKKKANGGERLVISYMSIGEAENYRYYWNKDWETNKPTLIRCRKP